MTAPGLSRSDPYQNPELFRWAGSMEGIPDWVDPAETLEERLARTGWRVRAHELLELSGALLPWPSHPIANTRTNGRANRTLRAVRRSIYPPIINDQSASGNTTNSTSITSINDAAMSRVRLSREPAGDSDCPGHTIIVVRDAGNVHAGPGGGCPRPSEAPIRAWGGICGSDRRAVLSRQRPTRAAAAKLADRRGALAEPALSVAWHPVLHAAGHPHSSRRLATVLHAAGRPAGLG